jgi:hypothetical protein
MLKTLDSWSWLVLEAGLVVASPPDPPRCGQAALAIHPGQESQGRGSRVWKRKLRGRVFLPPKPPHSLWIASGQSRRFPRLLGGLRRPAQGLLEKSHHFLAEVFKAKKYKLKLESWKAKDMFESKNPKAASGSYSLKDKSWKLKKKANSQQKKAQSWKQKFQSQKLRDESRILKRYSSKTKGRKSKKKVQKSKLTLERWMLKAASKKVRAESSRPKIKIQVLTAKRKREKWKQLEVLKAKRKNQKLQIETWNLKVEERKQKGGGRKQKSQH